MANWEQAPPVSGAAPPGWQSAPVVAGAASQPEYFDARDMIDREMGYGKYRQPEVPIDTTGNPEASQLPGLFGQAHNTFKAISHGAGDMTTLGLGDEIFAGIASPFRAGAEAIQGRGFDIGKAFQEELRIGEDRAANLRNLNPGAYDTGSAIGTLALLGRAPGRGVPIAAPKPSGLVKRAALQSGGIGATIGFGEPGTFQERAMNAAQGGTVAALLGAGAAKLLAPSAARSATPSVTELFSKGDAAFKAARASGAVVSAGAVQRTVGDLRSFLSAEGAITPSGKVADLPKINHALALAEEYATAPTTMEQLLRIRKQLAKAAGSTDKDERLLGTQLVRTFDEAVTKMGTADFVGASAPAGAKAIKDWEIGRGFWHTAKKAESVEKVANSAVKQSRRSAAVPLEQARRNKFGNFVENEKNLRGFSPEERKALQAVADGTVGGNIAKQIGRLAPTTPGGLMGRITVSGAPGAALGTFMGGPLMGAIGGGITAGGSIGVGYIGKAIASLGTSNRLKLAQALIRNGGMVPSKAVASALPLPVQNLISVLRAIGVGNSAQSGQAIAEALLSQRKATQ